MHVSLDGGNQPRFTHDGREIVYRNDRDVFAVDFDPADGTPGRPVRLIQLSTVGRINDGRTTGSSVAPDGSQFLMVEPVERADALPIRVILGRREELTRRVPRP